MKIRPPFLGSFILGLVLFYLFFLWQFPYAQVRKAMVQAFEETVPLTLSIGQVGPSFPANLRVENIRVSSDSLSFRVPDLTLHFSLLSFLTGKTHLAIRDSKNSSRLEGRFRQEKNKNRLNLQLNQMEVKTQSSEEFSFLLKLSGEASFQWEGENWEKGNGQAWALLERSEIQGTQISQAHPLLALFDTLRAELQLKEGIIQVKRLEASGKDTRFSLPKDLQFPIKGGIPPDLGILFQLPPK
jgi:type II secretion system protein N